MNERPQIDREMADRAEIADLIALACHAFDRRRWRLYAAIFDDEATCESCLGLLKWRDWVARLRAETEASLEAAHHQIGSALVRIDADAARAETYFSAYFRVRESPSPNSPFAGTGERHSLFAGGRYLDSIRYRDGIWRITERKIVADWRDPQPLVDAGLSSVPQEMLGGHGDADKETVDLVEPWLRRISFPASP